MFVPAVIAMRLPVLARESELAPENRRETMAAVSEKMAATAEGIAAAQFSMLASAANFWPEILSGKPPSILTGAALDRAMGAALQPASRKLRSNFRRLSRQR